ncbi:MAG: LysR family transcriptional regulator [Bdellovibrionales bacterium]|nr:LysR family transcriptional regulator [Ramlibacter sp.]
MSKAISRLEDELGQRLIHRTTRKITLTEEGATFLERCRQILIEVEDAETTIAQARAIPRGRLRVQMPIGFGRIVVAPALASFARSYPEVVLDVELSDRIMDIANEGKDAAIRIGDLRDSRVIARRLCELRFVTCASPEYLARHSVPMIPEDLVHHQCLGYLIPQTGQYRDWIYAKKDGEPYVHSVSGGLNINNAESLLDATISGAGVAMMATFVAAGAVRAGKLQIILREYVTTGPTVSVVYLPNKRMSPRLRAFVDFLTSLVPESPPWDRILLPPVASNSAAGKPASRARKR